MKILVTGSTGQLGQELQDLAKLHTQYDYVFADRNALPLDDLKAIIEALDSIKPELIINAGAYTAVDKAEEELELVDVVNHEAVRIIGEWCTKHKARFIHLSTDYVFDGQSKTPLTEEAIANPINAYGKSKWLGEKALATVCVDAVILRTAWVYSTYGHNFVKTMCRLMQELDEINVVNDQIGSPTYAKDLAVAIMQIVKADKWQAGVYHYSSIGSISWYEFALKIKEIKGYTCTIHGIGSGAYVTKAQRPHYSLLDNTKIKQAYAIAIPFWEDSLKAMLTINE